MNSHIQPVRPEDEQVLLFPYMTDTKQLERRDKSENCLAYPSIVLCVSANFIVGEEEEPQSQIWSQKLGKKERKRKGESKWGIVRPK